MSKKALNFFSSGFVSVIKEPKNWVFCLTEKYLLMGDEKGIIRSYEIFKKENRIVISEDPQIYQISKGRIDNIIWVPSSNILYVQSSGSLYVFQGNMDNKKEEEHSDQIAKITRNMHKENDHDLLIVNKKKKVKFLEYSTELQRLLTKSSREIFLPDIPENLEWYGKWLYFTIKGKLKFLDCSTGVTRNDDLNIKCMKYLKDSWVFYSDGIGLFMNYDGPKNANPITFDNKKNFITFGLYKNYLVSLNDSGIEYFDISTSERVQEMATETASGYSGKELLIGKDTVLYITGKKEQGDLHVWEITETPHNEQIHQLLKTNRLEEAFQILNNEISFNDENKPKQFEQLYLDCAWTKFKKFNERGYNDAYKYFCLTNFNPLEILYIYMNMLKIEPYEEFDYVKDKVKSANLPEMFKKETETKDEKLKALQFLIKILMKKREYILKNYDTSNEAMIKVQIFSFSESKLSLISLPTSSKHYTLQNLIQMINRTIVKATIKARDMKLCAKIIDEDNCGTNFLADGFIEKLNTEESQLAMSYVFEKEKNFDKALTILENFSKNGKNPQIRDSAIKKAAYILRSLKNNPQYKLLYEKSIFWMLLDSPELAFDIELENQMISIKDFINNILRKIEETKNITDQTYKEKFLKYINNDPKYRNENYQTMLLKFEIKKMFKLIPKTSIPNDDIKNNALYREIEQNLKNFFLYNKEEILKEIKGSWMLELEIFLYTKLGKFDLALKLWTEIGKKKNDFIDAFEFCRNNVIFKINLFNEFFNILLEVYKSSLKDNSNNQLVKLCKDEILNILSTFVSGKLWNVPKERENEFKGRKFEMLDPTIVIRQIPNDWKISEEILLKYIENVLKEYTHLDYKTKALNGIAKIDIIYKKKELLDLKNKKVLIENETICEFCRKLIGNSAFVVYPNMKIFHGKCCQYPNVCPKTKVDFTKKQLI